MRCCQTWCRTPFRKGAPRLPARTGGSWRQNHALQLPFIGRLPRRASEECGAIGSRHGTQRHAACRGGRSAVPATCTAMEGGAGHLDRSGPGRTRTPAGSRSGRRRPEGQRAWPGVPDRMSGQCHHVTRIGLAPARARWLRTRREILPRRVRRRIPRSTLAVPRAPTSGLTCPLQCARRPTCRWRVCRASSNRVSSSSWRETGKRVAVIARLKRAK
jgi:hypothetical protein